MTDFKNKCIKCGNSGIIISKDGDKIIECSCAIIKRLAISMPSYIRKAQVKQEHVVHPITETTNKSYYIFSSWADMKALIKVFMYKHPTWFVRITSDREIRDVGVGSTSKSSRGEDSSEAIFNTLQDLVGSPNLVIVRLNELGYKNKAAPGFLEEAISYRLDRDMTMWIISDKDKPFGQGCYAYSQSVWDLICSVFEKVEIQRISNQFEQPKQAVFQNYADVKNFDSQEYDTEDKKQHGGYENKTMNKHENVNSDVDDLASKFGAGIKKKSKSKSKF